MAEISAGVDIDDCCRISAADFMQIPQGAANREGRIIDKQSHMKPSVGRFGLRPEPRRAL